MRLHLVYCSHFEWGKSLSHLRQLFNVSVLRLSELSDTLSAMVLGRLESMEEVYRLVARVVPEDWAVPSWIRFPLSSSAKPNKQIPPRLSKMI